MTGPEEAEQLQIDYPTAPSALAIFSTQEKADAYHQAYLTPEWEACAMSRADLVECLADLRECGIEFVVFDPSRDGQGRILTVFQALIEFS